MAKAGLPRKGFGRRSYRNKQKFLAHPVANSNRIASTSRDATQELAYLSVLRRRSLLRPLERQHPVHFIGVGGIGMSALAKILVDQGHPVTGSDPRDNATVNALKRLGVVVYSEQTSATIDAVTAAGREPIVVISTAIPATNPEPVSYTHLTLPTNREV